MIKALEDKKKLRQKLQDQINGNTKTYVNETGGQGDKSNAKNYLRKFEEKAENKNI